MNKMKMVILMLMIMLAGVTTLYVVGENRLHEAQREAMIAEFMEDYNKDLYDGFIIWLQQNNVEFNSSDTYQASRLWVQYIKSLVPSVPTEI